MKSMHPMGVLVAVLLMSCSPAPLSEEELLQGLAEMEQHGPYQFKAQTWPRLVDKTIRSGLKNSLTEHAVKECHLREPSGGRDAPS